VYGLLFSGGQGFYRVKKYIYKKYEFTLISNLDFSIFKKAAREVKK
jgi:hypothetical protein